MRVAIYQREPHRLREPSRAFACLRAPSRAFATMQVDAVISNGERKLLNIDMSPDWTITTVFEGEPQRLVLQAVIPSICTGLIYLFANSNPSIGVAEPLPSAASELLLFAPLVPLLKCPEGFQALSWSAWKDVTSSTCFQDFGMPASMASSALGVGDDELDADSLDSASGLTESDNEMEEEACDSEAGLTEGESDGCSDASG